MCRPRVVFVYIPLSTLVESRPNSNHSRNTSLGCSPRTVAGSMPFARFEVNTSRTVRWLIRETNPAVCSRCML